MVHSNKIPSSSVASASAVIAGAASDSLSKGGGEDEIPETTFEFDSDALLAIAFLVTAIVAAKRLVQCYFDVPMCVCVDNLFGLVWIAVWVCFSQWL